MGAAAVPVAAKLDELLLLLLLLLVVVPAVVFAAVEGFV